MRHKSKKAVKRSSIDQIRDLRKMNRELDRFVYSASHDLKAPLRSIMGITAIAKGETSDTQQLMYLNMVSKSAMKLDNFINDLANFSRNTRLDVKVERVDFAEIMQDTLEMLSHMEKASKMETRIKISEEPFFSDPSRIRIIFGNIVSNAVKYQSSDEKVKPRLDLSIEINKRKAVIVFRDNGEGIAKENQKNIFKMFYRASERSEGSGLGLYIVKEVVRKLKGTISLSSALGKGCTFTITLPNNQKSLARKKIV